MSKRRKFTPEFKARAVLEELTGVKDKAEICREYQVVDFRPIWAHRS
jgi:transposase-like protein